MFYCRIKNNVSFYTMKKRQKVLFVCTGNSCRSQIAEGLLKHMAEDRYEVNSAGSSPSRVHPSAIAIMKEWNIDISGNSSDSIDQYLDVGIDIVITVCDHANDVCPKFKNANKHIHCSFIDPANAVGSETEKLFVYREVRDAIEIFINDFSSSINYVI